tara:strand:+ start:12913 stop:13665 length:753 start_codon:yes stop_codon:yes gene_type:complete
LNKQFKVLYLGPRDPNLDTLFIKEGCDVTYEVGPINLKNSEPDLIVSYGYRHLIKKEIFSRFRTINIHISYLPWNRGSDPNFWSFYDNTPKGVTIHEVDEGLDTGDIIYQKKIVFSKEEDDLKKTYDRLKQEATSLFISKWESIKRGNYTPVKQNESKATTHRHKEFESLFKNMKDKWSTKVKKIENLRTAADLKIIDEIESVRTKNNVNWMDLLRIAIKENPQQTKKILKNINSHDQKISELFEILSRE